MAGNVLKLVHVGESARHVGVSGPGRQLRRPQPLLDTPATRRRRQPWCTRGCVPSVSPHMVVERAITITPIHPIRCTCSNLLCHKPSLGKALGDAESSTRQAPQTEFTHSPHRGDMACGTSRNVLNNNEQTKEKPQATAERSESRTDETGGARWPRINPCWPPEVSATRTRPPSIDG